MDYWDALHQWKNGSRMNIYFNEKINRIINNRNLE
jgi:hypothetical protein